ncbi:phosphatidylinositol 3-kinase [Rhodovulum sulfidophilum]|uniref:Phosphatidylinositol 3-kinase n=1 Tax=Rhodovulum sulfidophilum TaxID=35806 RepID=A0A0D6B4J9_RHOSU|nr:phosphatidylinositol 3-kinase [Rhodovulum sulfidophilum]
MGDLSVPEGDDVGIAVAFEAHAAGSFSAGMAGIEIPVLSGFGGGPETLPPDPAVALAVDPGGWADRQNFRPPAKVIRKSPVKTRQQIGSGDHRASETDPERFRGSPRGFQMAAQAFEVLQTFRAL